MQIYSSINYGAFLSQNLYDMLTLRFNPFKIKYTVYVYKIHMAFNDMTITQVRKNASFYLSP